MPVTYAKNFVVIGFADLSGLSISLKDLRNTGYLLMPTTGFNSRLNLWKEVYI